MLRKLFKIIGYKPVKTDKKKTIPYIYHDIDIIFDVGGNIGQYAIEARENGFKGKIISFEPLEQEYAILLKKSKKDKLWIIHERCAVGANNFETKINVSKNSYSSSLLKMHDLHTSSDKSSIYVDINNTKVISLDSIFNKYRINNEKIYLKIDTQGYEKLVLEGIKENLTNISVIEIELSIEYLYEGQELYNYYFDFFEMNKFKLWTLKPGFKNKQTGQLLQFDAVFVKT